MLDELQKLHELIKTYRSFENFCFVNYGSTLFEQEYNQCTDDTIHNRLIDKLGGNDNLNTSMEESPNKKNPKMI